MTFGARSFFVPGVVFGALGGIDFVAGAVQSADRSVQGLAKCEEVSDEMLDFKL